MDIVSCLTVPPSSPCTIVPSRAIFQSPPPTSYDKYLEHIDTTMGGDTPIAFGLHPNAEIDFRTQQSDAMFKVKHSSFTSADQTVYTE